MLCRVGASIPGGRGEAGASRKEKTKAPWLPLESVLDPEISRILREADGPAGPSLQDSLDDRGVPRREVVARDDAAQADPWRPDRQVLGDIGSIMV